MARRAGRRRWGALVLLLAAAIIFVTSTGGFSLASADRAVEVDLVSDDEAYLGIDIDVEEIEGDGSDRKAISFVGFCTPDPTPLNASADVTKYKDEKGKNATQEALAVEWTADGRVSTVVLKSATAIENFPADGATSGSAEVGSGNPPTANQSPSSYCPDGEHEALKLEAPGDLGLAEGATKVSDKATVTVTITNRFPSDLTSVTATFDGGSPQSVSNLPLAPGESGSTSTTVECGQTVRIDIDASGPAVAVRTTRASSVDCS